MNGQRGGRRRRWAAAAGMVAVGLTASCGVHVGTTRTVGTTGAHQQQAASGQVIPASYAKQAAAATTSLRTGQFTITTSGSGAPAGASVSGAYDLDSGVMELSGHLDPGSTKLPGLAMLGGDMELVVAGGKVYVKAPAQLGSMFTKPWIALSHPSSGATSPVADMDPKVMLQRLQQLTGGLTVVGHETVDGVDTTHYHGTLDAAKALAKDHPEHAATLDQLGSVPIDVWIDGQGLLRRQTVSDGDNVTVTIDFTDLGAPVSVTVPPADQVQTFDIGALAKSFGADSGQNPSAN